MNLCENVGNPIVLRIERVKDNLAKFIKSIWNIATGQEWLLPSYICTYHSTWVHPATVLNKYEHNPLPLFLLQLGFWTRYRRAHIDDYDAKLERNTWPERDPLNGVHVGATPEERDPKKQQNCFTKVQHKCRHGQTRDLSSQQDSGHGLDQVYVHLEYVDIGRTWLRRLITQAKCYG